MPALLRILRRLARDRRGAVAVTLALSLIPLSVAALGAVDLTRAVSARSQLQDALDAAALAAAKSVTAASSPPSKTDNANLQAAGDASWRQNLPASPDYAVQSKTFQFSADGKSVTGDATATVQSLIVQALLGGQPMSVAAHAEVLRGGKNLEVALVLDRTGSMKGAPLTSLKAGATDFVNAIIPATPSQYTSKISLVPYTMGVNVGGALAAAAHGPAPTTGCPDSKGAWAYGCQKFTFTGADGVTKTWPASTCVTERTDANAYTDAAPSISPLGFDYPNPNNDNPCLSDLLKPLTSDRQSLLTEINGLTAKGSTAGHIGLAWGWYTLSPNFATLWPTAAGAAYSDKTTLKILVLMTDGEFNTAYRNGVISLSSTGDAGGPGDKINLPSLNGSSSSQAAALCANIKRSGITLYTVGYGKGVTGAARTLLTNCATDAGHAYFPQQPSDLQAAFDQIAQNVVQLRISK